MPHLSRQKVDQKVFNALFLNLSKSIAKIKNEKDASLFLDEILTKTERIMIGKRLTVVWLLYKDISSREIANNLKMSYSTIYRISLAYKQGEYKKIVETISKREDLFTELYKAFHLGGKLKPYGVKRKN